MLERRRPGGLRNGGLLDGGLVDGGLLGGRATYLSGSVEVPPTWRGRASSMAASSMAASLMAAVAPRSCSLVARPATKSFFDGGLRGGGHLEG